MTHPDDATALQVVAILRARYPAQDVKLVSAEELALAPHWSHHLDHAGVVTELRLTDGSLINPGPQSVVFNRLRYVPMPHFAGAKAADRAYAVIEMYALWFSWLSSLPCPVVNPVVGSGLGYQHHSQAEWMFLAGQAGLPALGIFFTTNPRRFRRRGYTAHHRLPTPDAFGHFGLTPVSPLVGSQPTFYVEPTGNEGTSVLICGEKVFGPLANKYRAQFANLRRLLTCDLLRVEFLFTQAGEPKVHTLTSFPTTHDPDELAAIVDLLEARATGDGSML